MNKRNTLKVFYDGGCIVCDAEMRVYQELGSDSGLEFINIGAPDFTAEQFGKSREEFMRALHVLDAEGSFHVGVDAFRLLWRTLPGAHYHLLARLAGLPGLRQLAGVGYDLFARNRHRLPRRNIKKRAE